MRANGKKATRLCPCGHSGDPASICRCSPERIHAYRQKISGPLLDRIDMVVQVPRLSPAELSCQQLERLDLSLRQKQVAQCRQQQLKRSGKPNSALQGTEIEKYCLMDAKASKRLLDATTKFHLSARAYHRIMKLARTIADFEGREVIGTDEISEAIGYRGVDLSSVTG